MAHQYQLIFNCTPSQLETALLTTLPAAGFSITRVPIKYTGIAVSGGFTFTATTSSVTNPTILTAVSSIAGLVIGQTITGAGIPANTTITAIGTNTVTMSASATASATITVTVPMTSSQIDFSYDGQYFLTFFGANPIPVALQTSPGVPQHQMVSSLIALISSALLATLGAPVPPNLAVPPAYVP